MRKTVLTAAVMCALLWANQTRCATFDVTTSAEFQTALTAAQANGENDTVNVAAGIYNVSSTLTFGASDNYALTIAGAGAATTILDGGGARQCMSLDNTGNGPVTVTGLTFRNGRADALGGGLAVTTAGGAIILQSCDVRNNVSERSAGGAYLGGFSGDITVDSCTIDGNSLDPVTGDDGGGLDIYIDTGGTADITLRNSTVSNNTIGECPSAVGSPDGAGVFMYHLGSGSTITVENNIISGNTALGGPAGFYIRVPVSTTFVFTGNTVSGNAAGRAAVGVSGGGVELHFEQVDMTCANNIITDNQAIGPYANGGGLDLSINTGGTCSIMNNVFSGNSAQQHGGGMSLLTASGVTSTHIAGNVFVDNEAGPADGTGGGCIVNVEANAVLANNTFYANSAFDAGGLAYYTESAGRTLTIANDIYRANSPNAISRLGLGSISATYANIQGGSGESYFGTGCIDADPLFYNQTSPAGADTVYATIDDGLHLTAASPSADGGSGTAVPAALGTDVAGQARVLGDAVDMGAYEGEAGISIITTTTAASTTTTTVAGRCPFARNAYGGVPVQGLRRLRDQRLATAFGAVLAAMYYRNMAEVGAMLQENPSLRRTFLVLTRGVLPQVQALFYDGTAVMPAGELEQVRAFLTKLQENASPELCMDIDFILSGMETGWLLEGLGITTG